MNKRKEAKKLVKKLDKEWSLVVKTRDNFKCIICGVTGLLHTHHIIPRQIHEFRHDIKNGITLCPRHHKYSYKISAHKNPLYFYNILKSIRLEQYEYIIDKYSKLYESQRQDLNTAISES